MAEGQHTPSSPRKIPLLIVGGVVVVGVLVALIVALPGGSDGPLGSLSGDTPESPEFAFEAARPLVITTAANPDPEAEQPAPSDVQAAKKKALAAALPAAKATADTLGAYYTAAFLDPANWQDAAYDSVFESFTGKAREEAASQLEVMTAGSEAGFNYDTIEPLPSSLHTKVLLDPRGLPASVVGIAKFQANGTGSSGDHLFFSQGQFVLMKIGGEWMVVSFSVSRQDEDTGVGASETDGATATSSGGTGSTS
ncbi:MAG TPA: hypothetical protein VI341_11605 [Actinomycetota bacterium]